MTIFEAWCKSKGFPAPEEEVRFHDSRRWRFDFGWRGPKIAVEQEGGVWIQGRHTRGSGYVRDLDKYNAAAVMGWTVIRRTPKQLCTKETESLLRQAFALKMQAPSA